MTYTLWPSSHPPLISNGQLATGAEQYFANLIFTARVANGWTRRFVGKKINAEFMRVLQLERAESRPTKEEIKAFAKIFGDMIPELVE